MKKKIMSICLVAVIAVMAIAGTSLAYLTDTDDDKNVMTVGKVDITQNEQQRVVDAEGNFTNELKSFENNSQKVIPAVKDPEYSIVDFGEAGTYNAFGDAFNPIDKIVTVTNEDDSEAVYVRTIVAFEHTDPNGDGEYSDGIAWKVHHAYNGANWDLESFGGKELDNVEINGTLYSLVVFTYKTALAPDATTEPSLLQVFFDKTVTNEDLSKVGAEYNVLVLSQAVQAAGWGEETLETAKTALNSAFCEITDENIDTIVGWLEKVE